MVPWWEDRSWYEMRRSVFGKRLAMSLRIQPSMREAVNFGASGAMANRRSSSHVCCGSSRATGLDQAATA
jgi:hypothetical protein